MYGTLHMVSLYFRNLVQLNEDIYDKDIEIRDDLPCHSRMQWKI